MKKKLASLIVMVAVLVSMLSTTVFADTESSKNQLETIKTQMEQTADYLANHLVEKYRTPMDSKEIIDDLSSTLFYLNKSGIQSESLNFLNNTYRNAINDTFLTYEKIVDNDEIENADTYVKTISALLAMGDDPTNINVNGTKHDIVGNFNDFLKNDQTSLEPYLASFVWFGAVYGRYKDSYDAIASELGSINEIVISYYVKNEVEGICPVLENDISSMGIDNVLDSNEYKVYKGTVELAGDNQNAWDVLLNKLNSSNLPDAGHFTNNNSMLCLKVPIKDCFYSGELSGEFGPTFEAIVLMQLINSADDSRLYETAVYDNPQTTVTLKDVSNSVLETIHNSINKEGIFVDKYTDGLIPEVEQRAYALSVASIHNRLGDADKLYTCLNLLRESDGSYKAASELTHSSAGATGFAFFGLLTYYYAKSGLGNLYDLSITDTSINPDNKLEMKEVATHDWVVGSDFGFTVSSPANFASFWDVAVDGSSAIAGSAQVGADGVSTYAAVGGGSMRVETGSTIVTLSPEYLATLAPGEHTIRVQSANGYAETTLNIVATPQTGDSSNMGLFVTLTACGLGMAVVAVTRKVKADN